MTTLSRYLLAALLLCGASAAADDDELAALREEFLAAHAAAGATGEANDSRALRRYPLYPYLEGARLAAALRATTVEPRTDERAAQFLERHGEEPAGWRLRRAWLASLARRSQWPTFLAHYRDGGDAVLQCQQLNARVAQHADDDGSLAADVLQRWLTPRRLPEECEAAFAWLRERGGIGAEEIEQRVRLLLEGGEAPFARVIARRLPIERTAPLSRWADLIEQPLRALDALLAGPFIDVEPEALLDGFGRLARAEPLAALERLPRLEQAARLDAAAASRHALALALGLAWDRRPEALTAFATVSPADMNDYALGWRARAALWNGDWPLVAESIAAMSPAAADETRWRYWAARAAEERGAAAEAAELYRSILPRDNFYAAHAAARLGSKVVPHDDPLPLDANRLERLEGEPFFARARELLALGWRNEAVTEWLAGFGSLDSDARPQTVHLAARWDWHDVAIATASREGVFYDYTLLYPTPFRAEVTAAANAAALDRSLLYGLIRQESLFRPDARSAAGAMGLAQLIPDTARIVARLTAEPVPGPEELLDPERNVRLGAAYLRNLLERFDGQTVVALAGYNAGPRAAGRWLPDEPIAADVWIENIPFNETREYVQRVLWHSVVFAWLDGGEPQDTSRWPAWVVPAAPEPSVALLGR